MQKQYIDNENRKVFKMDAKSFSRFMEKTKLANGKPRYEEFDGKKKATPKPSPKAEVAEVVTEKVNTEMAKMTAVQLREAIKVMEDLPTLQSLSQDSRATVSAAAQKRLAELAVNGGDDE